MINICAQQAGESRFGRIVGRCTASMIVATIAIAVLGIRGTVAAQGADLASARITHVGVVVPDIDAAVREYVRVMGFQPVKINSYPIPMPDGTKTEFKTATFYMPNFFIEVIQPVTTSGPFHEHLQAHGKSIHHVGLHVPGAGGIDDVRSALEQQGGHWVLGAKGANYAYVAFQPALGTTIEVNRGATGAPGNPPPTSPSGDVLPPLASLTVTHVGFAASDTAAVAAGFARAFGTMPPKVMEYKDAQYPPDSKWSPSAYLRLTMWNQGGIGIELIESVGGPTPWSEYVAHQKGTAAQHVAINVGNRMDETIADLVAKGGTWTNGKRGGNYAYLDFSNTLGLVFELNGTSKTAAK